MSCSDSVLVSAWKQVGVDGGKLHNFCYSAEKRDKVPREETLLCFGMGMTIDDFQIAGMGHDVAE